MGKRENKKSDKTKKKKKKKAKKKNKKHDTNCIFYEQHFSRLQNAFFQTATETSGRNQFAQNTERF